MKISERVRNMLRDFLRIEPAHGQSIIIRESMTWETSCIRNNVWYRSDAAEIEQFFKAVDGNGFESTGRFWASAPSGDDVRKAHSGLPAIMVNTLAYIVKSDLQEAEIAGEGEAASLWSEISKDSGFSDLVGEAVAGTLVTGDGAFKISIDKETKQVTGYEVQYSTSKTFKKATTKTVKSYQTTSLTLKKLKSNKKYFVRVRTFKTVDGTKFYSGWSSYKTAKTK